MDQPVCSKCDQVIDETFMEAKDIQEAGCSIFTFSQNNHCWCFCLEALYHWIKDKSIKTNPFNRMVMDEATLLRLKEAYEELKIRKLTMSLVVPSYLKRFINSVVDYMRDLLENYNPEFQYEISRKIKPRGWNLTYDSVVKYDHHTVFTDEDWNIVQINGFANTTVKMLFERFKNVRIQIITEANAERLYNSHINRIKNRMKNIIRDHGLNYGVSTELEDIDVGNEEPGSMFVLNFNERKDAVVL